VGVVEVLLIEIERSDTRGFEILDLGHKASVRICS